MFVRSIEKTFVLVNSPLVHALVHMYVKHALLKIMAECFVDSKLQVGHFLHVGWDAKRIGVLVWYAKLSQTNDD